MDELLSKVIEARRNLRNQYAYIEYLYPEDFSEPVSASANQISAERERLQHPYAFLDEKGGYSATAIKANRNASQTSKGSRRYKDVEIEAIANNLLREMWKKSEIIWGRPISDPVDAIDPAKALELRGFEFYLEEELAPYADSDFKVAGIIDPETKTVRVSKRFPIPVQSFTSAHELGHAMLHNIGGGVIHRDRPMDGVQHSREPMEVEADKFASHFLMPSKLVRTRFVEIFGTDKFIFNEDAAFSLNSVSLNELKKKYSTPRHLSKLLASATTYNGNYYYSLAEQFRVSVETMAIRIEELALIDMD